MEKELTDKEIRLIMDKANFPKGLTVLQAIRIAYWSMFNRGRLSIFCSSIEKGMSIYYAFKKATDNTKQG